MLTNKYIACLTQRKLCKTETKRHTLYLSQACDISQLGYKFLILFNKAYTVNSSHESWIFVPVRILICKDCTNPTCPYFFYLLYVLTFYLQTIMTVKVMFQLRIRTGKHSFEVHFLLAIWTGLLLPNYTPTSYTKLMKSEESC